MAERKSNISFSHFTCRDFLKRNAAQGKEFISHFPFLPLKGKKIPGRKSLVLEIETADPCESASFIKEVEREERA